MHESDLHGDPSPDRQVGQAIVLYLACLVLLLTVGIWVQLVSLTGGLVFTLLVLILLPAVVFVRVKRLPVLHGLRIRAVNPMVILVSLLVGAGAWSLAIGIHELIASVIGPPPSMDLELDRWSDYLTMLVIAAVLPGICEECLFRGAIQGVLERRGQWFGVLLSAALFGLFHLDPWRILPAAFLGCVMGWLTIRTQSIIPAIAAHFANNATAISTAYFLKDSTALPTWLLPVLAIVFLFSIVIMFKMTFRAATSSSSNPLASVPAAVPRLVAWASGLAVVIFAVAIAGGTVLIMSLVTTVEMNDDALLPHIKSGDQLVLIKNGAFRFKIKPGDTISFKRNNETVTRVVARVDGDQVFVREGETETQISLHDVIGKMVQIVPKQ